VRRGRVLARAAPASASLQLPGRPSQVDWTLRQGADPAPAPGLPGRGALG
jgi:cytosine/creatinine deaminase